MVVNRNMGRNAWNYHENLARYLRDNGRVLVRCTGDYSRFGICCPCAEPGDTVVLISGASLPMVIREGDRHYKVVGPALLGGIMNGELWKENMKDLLEEIVLE
jgi:hypothetical protein